VGVGNGNAPTLGSDPGPSAARSLPNPAALGRAQGPGPGPGAMYDISILYV
jgi:hypothetical protein